MPAEYTKAVYDSQATYTNIVRAPIRRAFYPLFMEWLKARIEEIGKKPIDLARHLDIAPARVYEMLKGDRRLQTTEIGPAAAFLEWPEAHVMALLAGKKPGLAETAAPSPVLPSVQVVPEPARSGRPDIPVWASAQAGDDGAIILVPDPIDYIRRSERMQFVRNPFAFNVLGDSMYPAIEHGDQVVVNPSVVAAPGNDCVFIHEGPDGMLALIKRLLRPRTNGWHVRQFNPPKDFEIPRPKWARVHAIAEIRKRGVG